MYPNSYSSSRAIFKLANLGAERITRRSAIELIIELIIGRMKSDGKLSRCYLKDSIGDTVNTILSVTG